MKTKPESNRPIKPAKVVSLRGDREVKQRMVSAIDAKIRYYQGCKGLTKYLPKEIYDAGHELFGNDVAVATWLCAPARALGGNVPLRVMRSTKGKLQVLNILRALEHGVFL